MSRSRDARRVLGVEAGASATEIDRAWKQRLREVHPDRHPDATPAERTRLDERTREVNAAHDLLGDLANHLADGAANGDRRAVVCRQCGAVPVAMFTFGVPMRRFGPALGGSYCRSCALHHGRRAQRLTLLVFWFVGFPIGAIAANAKSLWRAALLREPHGGDHRALDPTGSVMASWGFLVFVAVPILAIVVLGRF